MTFNKIFEGLTCNCLDSAVENTKDSFLRVMKIGNENFSEIDLKSKWEEGISCSKGDDKSLCSHRGISLSKVNDSNENEIIELYKTTFKFNQNLRRYIAKIKFMAGAGKIKATSSKSNMHHNDFFKCDEFTINKITLLDKIDVRN
jgi:hypothetical protein